MAFLRASPQFSVPSVVPLPVQFRYFPPMPDTTVTWKPAGPYVIEGPIRVLNNEGDLLDPPPTKIPGQVKLCGCGHSLNKPFCDGSHKR